MVYCGSGTETFFVSLLHKKKDPMVYCGSGTETVLFHFPKFLFVRSYGLLRKRY